MCAQKHARVYAIQVKAITPTERRLYRQMFEAFDADGGYNMACATIAYAFTHVDALKVTRVR